MTAGDSSRGVLAEIMAQRRESVEHRKRLLPLVALKMAVQKRADPARDFRAAISAGAGSDTRIIAELKKASPSRGLIRADFQPVALALELAGAGAKALSVLTEEDFFQGSLQNLKEARAAVAIPALRKDFIFDTWQVWESRAVGADSFLLIVSVLDDESLVELLELGRQLGMEALVEVHSEDELSRALRAEASIIGVNSRDLRDFSVKLETAKRLIEKIPDSCVAVAESGIQSREDIESLTSAGYDAFLIGEQLMRSATPGAALQELLSARAAKPVSS